MKPLKLRRLVLGTFLVLTITPLQVVHGQSSAPTTSISSNAGGGSASPPAAPPSSNGGLEEIVVTAQRRSENVQTVPIAVTVLTADALESKRVETTDDLNLLVPGLNVSRATSTGVTYIRGVGTNTVNPGVEPPIAFYTDGVYAAGAYSDIASFSNLDHIEVLKGPQGTLFGRNSMGGLINIITKDPSEEFSGHITGGYGNYDTGEGNLYLTGPVAQGLAADISLYGIDQGDGWGTNLTTGRQVNYRDEAAARTKWQYKPSDNTTFTFAADYSRTVSDWGNIAQPLPGLPTPPASFPAVFRGTIYDATSTIPSKDTIINYGAYFRINHDLGAVRIADTTAYRQTRVVTLIDDGESQVPTTAGFFDPDITQTFSQELQILSPESSDIQWIAGLYYFNSNAGNKPLTISGPGEGAKQYERIYESINTNSYSGFAQMTIPIFTPQTKLTLGIRYTEDLKSIVGSVDTALASLGSVAGDKSWGDLTYRAALQRQLTPNVLAYVSTSTGFKSGTYNASNPLQPPVNPETLTDYEAGLKTELADHRIRLNLSGFYYDYKNLQLSQSVGSEVILSNAARAEIYGGEIEGEADVVHNFSITYGVSLLHSEYTSFKNAVSFVTSPTTGLGVATTVNETGNELQRTPTQTYDLGFDYSLPTSVGEFGLDGTYAYNGGLYFDPDNQYRQGGYGLVNGELRWRPNDRRYQVRAWIKNALNKQYYDLIRTGPGIPPDGYPGPPRTFGVSFELKF
jgi:iron complex outermembrane receptor protein